VILMHTQCSICDARINVEESVEVAEIISCTECKNKLEVTGKSADTVTVKEAPKVEEDWGE